MTSQDGPQDARARRRADNAAARAAVRENGATLHPRLAALERRAPTPAPKEPAGGLARLCQLYGAMTIQGMRYVWDHAAGEAVPESEMPDGSERWMASEKAKWTAIKAAMDLG